MWATVIHFGRQMKLFQIANPKTLSFTTPSHRPESHELRSSSHLRKLNAFLISTRTPSSKGPFAITRFQLEYQFAQIYSPPVHVPPNLYPSIFTTSRSFNKNTSFSFSPAQVIALRRQIEHFKSLTSANAEQKPPVSSRSSLFNFRRKTISSPNFYFSPDEIVSDRRSVGCAHMNKDIYAYLLSGSFSLHQYLP